MTAPRSFSELYDIYRQEVEASAELLTDWNEGSINDILAGVTSTAVSEAMGLIVDSFKKTLFEGADGPEVTGGPDDLQTLAVDHFGDAFQRPPAQKAVGIVTFTRASDAAGDVNINLGTIVKTQPNANGEVQRFSVLNDVTMTGLTVNASVQAVVAGPKGNVATGGIKVIETALTDSSVTVLNTLPCSGGAEAQNDSQYRQTIKNLIEQLKGGTEAAVEAKAKTVSGVVNADAIETEQAVIGYNLATGEPEGEFFLIPRVRLYIADANGSANDALISAVRSACDEVRAVGVYLDVLGATAQTLDWTASITLNPAGPNFAELQSNVTRLQLSMKSYLETLEIGSDFVRTTANQAMLAIWGPGGTGDLTAFTTSTPTGDVSTADNVKLVAGETSII